MRTWRSAGSSNVLAITSALTLRCMSVTSSGRSSMRSIMMYVSGWFSAMALATSFKSRVLPVFGGATIRPRCPLPIGENMSTTRVDILHVVPPVILNFSSGNSGVRCSNGTRSRIKSSERPFTRNTSVRMKYLSFSRGGRTPASTTSPVLSPYCFICA